MTTLTHSWYMIARHLRNIMRQPLYIAFTLVQPVIYLLLFGELFKRVVELPGFTAGSYITFLTPGIVVQTVLFTAGWSGMSVIEDLDRGVLDRFLISPASRLSLITGRLIQLAVVAVIQSLIIFGLGLLRGASFPGGLPGMAVNFVLLPLTFLSSVFMARELMPGWMHTAARFNPVSWAVEAGRATVSAQGDWGLVLARLGSLLVLAILCAWFATRAFRAYQRSV